MKILLTGANGNFGREFIKKTSAKVIALNRGEWGVLDYKLSQGIDVVVHAANDLHSRASESPVGLMDSNLMSTTTLLESLRKHRIKRMIYLSSCAVYGEDLRTNEETKCSPVSTNGVCKFLNERLIAEYCLEHGIKYEILRIFNMYGLHDRFSIISHLEHAVKTATPFVLRNMGRAQRDFIHVSDVATIVAKLVENPTSYTHLNIGTGVATKVATLVNIARSEFPELRIQNSKTTESEYSRADITKLQEIFDMNFIDVVEHVKGLFENKEGGV